LLPLCMMVGTVMHAQDETKISQGTVNIALANANGIVLLTDSVQSVGGRPRPEPVQKLFRLDENSVCSIAGFAGEIGWIPPELNTDVAGIVSGFKDELSQKPVPELETKLKALAFLVGFYIDLVANRREVLAPTNQADYRFEVIVAGYDADGKPKIEKLVLTPVVLKANDGHKFWMHTTSPPEVVDVVHKLATPVLGGIDVVSHDVLNNPQKYSDSAIVRRYIRAKKQDSGESLTLEEMSALASFMAARTAKVTTAVGPPDQIAFLTKGKILRIDQPHFPDPQRPMKFAVMTDLKIQGALMFATAPDVHMMWIRTEFVGIRGSFLQLDGQFFYGCEIRDSIVQYGGGLTGFTPENKNLVVNTMMLPGGPPVEPAVSQSEMLRILNAFHWAHEPPSGPPLPPTVGPK